MLRGCAIAALFVALAPLCPGQLTTGALAGLVVDEQGSPRTEAPVLIEGEPGLSVRVRCDQRGRFQAVLPHGLYRLSAEGAPPVSVAVVAFEITPVTLVVGSTGLAAREPALTYADTFTVPGRLLLFEPTTVSEPLDFSGLASMRLPLLSQRAYPWSDVRYTLEGLNAGDPYQPGRPVILPDPQAVSGVVASPAYGSQVAVFLAEPAPAWHGNLATTETGAPLAADNLPRPATRNGLARSETFDSFTRDHADLSLPMSHRADLLVSGTGQWASESLPRASAGEDLGSRLLLGNASGRVALGRRDQLDFELSGSRSDLSDWGIPAALEALAGFRAVPSFTEPWGFAGLRETDHLDFLQGAWTRQIAGPARVGTLQVRYGFSTAHLETRPSGPRSNPGSIDLLDGTTTGAPPLANLAVRTRENVKACFEPGEFKFAGRRHAVAVGGGWELANVRNRFTAPGDSSLITVAGAPAYILELNTPLDSRARVLSPSVYVRDRAALSDFLTVDVAAVGDFARGSLPAQASLAGRADVIAWNSVSPRTGLTLALPFLRRLVLRGNYARLEDPLAARYLDFANPNSLGGAEYQPGAGGRLLARFGGPYSSVDSRLKRSHADEFNLAAEVALPGNGSVGLRLFRRDEKDRLAAVNIGVPATSFQPVRILDPGPDSVPGTFDDQTLTVFAQDPATLGNDRYLLTNPRGLRMLDEGVIAEVGTRRGRWQAHASFMAVKSWGPTNPGESALENDPGVIGALFADPNANIDASGRSYFDRGFVGKVQLMGRLPRAFGGLEWANMADYLDGLPFARRLLVTELPQGPFLVATTIRGSPEGGNRAEYVLDWNLRLSRVFLVPHGTLRLALDVLNVTNAGNRVEESDLSGPTFLERLPVAIEPPRFLRFGVNYRF
jgi:hypothetical protein